jgi:hypothetical protein
MEKFVLIDMYIYIMYKNAKKNKSNCILHIFLFMACTTILSLAIKVYLLPCALRQS